MKTHFVTFPKSVRWPHRKSGFALVVTLSLMILLTIVAVGLLSLAGVSLRSTVQNSAMQEARANARVALMLAIGDLQKQLGPDPRISLTADQISSGGDESSTPRNQRNWTGAYKSWAAAQPNSPRPTPEFLQWFVSGDPTKVKQKDFAGSAASGTSVQIVSKNSVGDADPVTVPAISGTQANGSKSRFAWWVGDQGTKALIAPSKDDPARIADARADAQTVATANLAAAKVGQNRPFDGIDGKDPKLSMLCSWQSTELLAGKSGGGKPDALFHDFSTWNRGLVTNVRKGGFRKDLSMELERPLTQQPDATRTALYTAGGEIGINFQELWSYYNLCNRTNNANRGLKWSTSSIPFTTGGSLASGTPYLELLGGATACQDDEFFFYKQPVIIDYQLVISLQTRVVNGVNRLHIVTDPILTFWNPLDVPVVVPQGTVYTVKYWQVPYDLRVTKNGSAFNLPLAGFSKSDNNFLSLQMGNLERLVFRPGEVVKMSQSQDLLARSQYGSNIHALDGKKGFNFGKGMAWEAMTREGTKVDLATTDSLVFQSAIPNDLTAGATAASGHVIGGGYQHSRHFSLTHHEYYIGQDRGSDSLGIGGIYLDYDFGNKRLAPNASRSETQPGTKNAGERYYANQKNEVFKTFTDGRTIPAGGAKMPIMLFSFHVKTENGNLTNTRCLSRFNPKALHVDFYDLNRLEREALPYEYTVELLNGWRSANDSLQVNTTGQGYFGAAMNAADGCNYVTTHSVPREPLVSLAALQSSFANGFNMLKPKYGYAALSAREPLMPQISHAIGNSVACPLLDSGKTEGSISGGRPIADHSYLANQALWDDWFLSGIAPQNSNTFGKVRTQKDVATSFFSGREDGKLPVQRFLPNLRGTDAGTLANKYFGGSRPKDEATTQIASYLTVDGMFNVNSTSVEAWKSLLGARNGRSLVVRDASGKESIGSGGDVTPVANLMGPMNLQLKSGSTSLNDAAQWVGWRALNDSEIESLAQAIVREVRKRGPFLSLADFINRRVGSDKELARAGAVQSALDSLNVPINSGYNQGSRSSGGGSALSFKDAERGPLSYGAPGVVKQADILTPIAPVLSARSDTFLVRGYGEKVDESGKVLARAWCEAVVQRDASFVDPTDVPEKDYASINSTNKIFGRRFNLVSFRWLDGSEA